MEDGAALHLQRRARMVGQHEDRHMVRWIGAPPAFPLIVRPGSAQGPEHVAAHDPGAEILERACREVVVDAGRPAVSPLDVPLEGAGWKEPLVQLFAAAAQRLVTVLVGAGAKAIGRHAKGVHAKLGHGRLLDRRCMEFLNDVTPVVRHPHVTHRPAANADPNPARPMNVRAAWKASHRLRMLDQSDGSVSTVHRAMAASIGTLTPKVMTNATARDPTPARISNELARRRRR